MDELPSSSSCLNIFRTSICKVLMDLNSIGGLLVFQQQATLVGCDLCRVGSDVLWVKS